jgi:hypothetical protein
VAAIEAYEAALATETPPLAVYVDLAVLYFCCTDFGYAAAHKIPDAIVAEASSKTFQCLDIAEQRFGSHPSVEFWRTYVRWAALGDQFETGPSSRAVENGYLEPAFALLSITGDVAFEVAARRVLDEVKDGRTARARYVASVLHSALSRLTTPGK